MQHLNAFPALVINDMTGRCLHHMLNKSIHSLVCAFLAALFLLLSGCEHRYWYRHKIKAAKRKTVHLYVVNHSPGFISRKFENAIEQTCVYALHKKGYEVVKDTPEYHFFVHMKVDSFYTKSKWFLQNGYNIFKPTYTSYYSDNNVKEISFEYNLVNPDNELLFWESRSEFFYFDNEGRDLRRSKSMINYALKRTP
jgi:hypothetical protein